MDMDNEVISASDQKAVNRLRRALNDTEELNQLEGVKESTDIELLECIQDALDELISTPPMTRTDYTIQTVPWAILKLGAILNVLTQKGILSARNTLTYRDAGGITVQDFDKHGRYINYYNFLLNKFMLGSKGFKMSENIDSCYGEIPSPYSELD